MPYSGFLLPAVAGELIGRAQITRATDCLMNSPTPSKDVAVPGLLRPPLVLLAAIALGVVLNLIWPFRFIPSALVMAQLVLVFRAVPPFALPLRAIPALATSLAGTARTHRLS